MRIPHFSSLAKPFLAFLCLLAVSALTAASQPAQAQAGSSTIATRGLELTEPQRMRNTPAEVLDGRAVFLNHYDPSQMLRLAFVLRPPHLAEERQFLDDLQNKQSPLFHQFLTADEWNSRFAPSAEDEQAVVDWVQSQGLTVTHRYPNRLLVNVEAPAGVIERALQITLNSYRLQADRYGDERIAFFNDRDPALPAHLSEVVQSVAGLNSILIRRPAGGTGRYVPQPDYTPGPVVKLLSSSRRDADPAAVDALAQAAAGEPSITAPSPSGFSPAYLWASDAYDYIALMNLGHCCNPYNEPNNSPPETSIAIAAFGDVVDSDIAGFRAGFPYLAVNYQKIAIDGGYTCNNQPKKPDDNCIEVTMDSEWALATANSEGSGADTAKVYIYEAPSLFSSSVTLFNQMLTDGYARTMSTSWDFPDSTNTGDQAQEEAENYVLNQMAGQGWTLVASSGDRGSTGGCDDNIEVMYPASDPNVVGAGGTSLSESNNANYEVGWTGSTVISPSSCLTNHGGSTGGFSTYFTTVPAFQSGMGFSSRAVPDLSLDAVHGHDVYFLGGWNYVGGTSVAAPMLAGFFAQENAYLLSIGYKCGSSGTSACSPMGNVNFPIYELGKTNFAGTSGRYPFYDILTGCNSNDITAQFHLGYYCAKAGFDEVTGWGSANMLQLAWGINYETAPASGTPSVTFDGPAINTWINHEHAINWEAKDNPGRGNFPGTGIAGATTDWDVIPSDPTSEPHGGQGNSFYAGPQFVNQSSGCLSIGSSYCPRTVGQGCHTAHVEVWNNQGLSTGDVTYGPVCYDSVAPTIASSNSVAPNSSGWTKGFVLVSLTATDPGGSNASGVSKIYYGSNNPACTPANTTTCTVYSSHFTFGPDGIYKVTAFSQDVAGNFSPVITDVVKYDSTPPVTAINLSGNIPSGAFYYNSAVTVTLSATDNLSGVEVTYYQLDNGTAQVYSGPFTISTPGIHTISVQSIDFAGNFETNHSSSLTIDAPTATVLSTSPNPSASGQSVTLTAAVSTTLAGPATGSVNFYNGTTLLGNAPLAGGSASMTIATLPSGADALKAVYSNIGYYLPSSSAAVTQDVRVASVTSLTSSNISPTWGLPVTLTATVKSSSPGRRFLPTGTVYFRYGLTQIGSATLNSAGVASLTTTALPVGAESIDASYAGDSNYGPSGSVSVAETVTAAPTTTTIEASANPIKVLATVTFTVKVATPYLGAPPPSGTVYIKEVGAKLAIALTLTNGTATYSTSALPVGTTNFVATYEATEDYAGSTSTTFAEVVDPLSTSTKLSGPE